VEGGCVIVGDPVERARELIVFADGFTAAGGGNAELARLARVAAGDVLELAQALDGERSARVAMQTERDRLLEQRFPGAGAA
jgi:hypothetical protein